MKKILYTVMVVSLIISASSIPVSAKECGVNNTGCMRKKLTVERKVVRILKAAASDVIGRVDDSYMKNTLTKLFESCSERPEIDDGQTAGGAADKAFYELTEIKSQSRCYQEVLSNSFVTDLSAEAVTGSLRNHL